MNILKKFLPLRDNGNSTCFADNSKNCQGIPVQFFSGMGRLTGNTPFDFGADPDKILDP